MIKSAHRFTRSVLSCNGQLIVSGAAATYRDGKDGGVKMVAARTLVVGVLVALSTSSAHSQFLSEAEKRKALLPAVIGATNCVAREVLIEPNVVEAFDRGKLFDVLEYPVRRCSPQINYMISEHDRIHGFGTGRTFFQGPYLDDLPRAVTTRVSAEINRRRAEEAKAVEEARENARRQKAEADAEAARRVAENEAREAKARAEKERAHTEFLAETARQEEIKLKRLDTAMAAMAVLRDRFYECAEREIQALVRSGETAETLATAVMTICDGDYAKVPDSLKATVEIEAGRSMSPSEENLQRERLRSTIRDRVLASAVKAKAGANRPSGSGL